MRVQAILSALLFALVVLAGCMGKGATVPSPYDSFEPTGRTIHLKMTVVDLLGQQVHPGMKANLWAFCAEPADPGDQASADAIELWAPLPGDVGPTDTSGRVDESRKGKCSVPGPTIRVKQGDRVIVDFSHGHVHPHTIHWHGQFVPYTSDGAPGSSQGVVESGQSFTYDFIAAKAGTLWYHCHVDTQLHAMQGLYGMFIVEPQGEDATDTHDIPKQNEYYLVFSGLRRSIVEAVPGANPHSHPAGCLVSGTPRCQNPPIDPTPDTYLINGHSYPFTEEQHQEGTKRGSLVELEDGGKVRLRLLNAGDTFETVHLHGHDMQVVARDGTPLASPFWVDTLTIGPAERYDVVVLGRNPGVWMLHTHVNLHEVNDFQSCGGMHTMLVYPGFHDKMHQFEAQNCLPGGQPYDPLPQAIPADALRFNQSAPLTGTAGTTSEPHARHIFEVELPCAVRSLSVYVTVHAATAVGQQLNNVVIDITKPGPVPGSTPERLPTIAMGTATDKSFTIPAGPEIKGVTRGTWTVDVHGTLVGSTVTVTSVVDYYETFLQAKQASHRFNYADCILNPEI